MAIKFDLNAYLHADTSEAKKNIESVQKNIKEISDSASSVNFDNAVESSDELSRKISEVEDKLKTLKNTIEEAKTVFSSSQESGKFFNKDLIKGLTIGESSNKDIESVILKELESQGGEPLAVTAGLEDMTDAYNAYKKAIQDVNVLEEQHKKLLDEQSEKENAKIEAANKSKEATVSKVEELRKEKSHEEDISKTIESSISKIKEEKDAQDAKIESSKKEDDLIKDKEASYKNFASVVKKAAVDIQNVNEKSEKEEADYLKNQKKLTLDFASAVKKSSADIQNSYERSEKLTSDFASAAKESAVDIQSSYERSEKLTSDFASAVKESSVYMQNLNEESEELNENTKETGKALTAAGKLAVDAFEKVLSKVFELGKEVWNLGITFEKSFQKVKTLADNSVVSFDSLSTSLLGLSSQYGVSIADLNNAAYEALSSSVKTEDLVEMVNIAQKSAIAGFTDTTTAISGLTSVMNAYGMSVEEADDLANKFLITQNLGKTTFGEIAANIGEIAPNAKIAGISIDDVLAAIATLTAQGLSTSEAITQINGALNSIIDPTKEAKEAADSLGIAFNNETLKSMGLIDFLNYVRDAAGENNDALTDLFGNIRGFKALAGLTEQTKLYNEALRQMSEDTSTLDEAFTTMTDTVKYKSDVLKTTVENIGALTFDNVTDSLKGMFDYLNSIASDIYDSISFSGVGEEFKDVIDGIIENVQDLADLFITDLGPEMLDMLLNILEIFNNLVKAAITLGNDVLKPIIPILNNILSLLSSIDSSIIEFAAISVGFVSAFNAISTLIPLIKTAVIELGAVFSVATSGAGGLSVALSAVAASLPAFVPILAIFAALAPLFITAKNSIEELNEILDSKLEGPNFVEQANKNIAALKEEKKAFDDLRESSEQGLIEDTSSIDNIQRLWDELEGLVDESGRVIENDERANQIINLLNNNYDMNITYQNGMIQGYKNLSSSMDGYLENLRKEARIRAGQEQYDLAIVNTDKLKKQKEEVLAENEDLLKSFEVAYSRFEESGNKDWLDVAGVFAEQLNANKLILSEVESELSDYQSVIDEYEDLFKDSAENTADSIKCTIDSITNHIKGAKDDAVKSSKEYLSDIEDLMDSELSSFERTLDAEKDAREDALDAQLDALEDYYDKAMDSEKERHDAIIDNLKKEKEEKLGQFDEEEYQRELQKEKDELEKLQQKRALYGDYSTLLTSADRKDANKLDEDIQKQKDKIAEKEYEHQRDLDKQALTDKYDAKIEAENKLYEDNKEALNKEKEAAVDAKKEEIDAAKDAIKEEMDYRKNEFKEAQKSMLEEVKTFSTESLAELTTNWDTYVNHMSGTFNGSLSSMSSDLKDYFLSLDETAQANLSSLTEYYTSLDETMQSAFTKLTQGLLDSRDNLKEYADILEGVKDIQGMSPERAAAKASALDLTVQEAVALSSSNLDLKQLASGVEASVSYGTYNDNSVGNNSNNSTTINNYYNNTKVSTSTYSGLVK